MKNNLKKKILLVLFISFSKLLISQNKIAIDKIDGVGEYKWGMSKEQINCKRNEYGWCDFYPTQFYIGGFKVFKIEIDVSDKKNGLFIICLYLEDESITIETVLKELKKKYGTPSKYDPKYNYYEWYGDKVMIYLGTEKLINSKVVRIYYEKLDKKIETGF